MKIDRVTGTIGLEQIGLVIRPGTTLDEFLSSSVGAIAHLDVKAQQYTTYSVSPQNAANALGASFDFDTQRLDSVRLKIDRGSNWSNWSEEKELKRKLSHDKLLNDVLGSPPYTFPWGKVESVYDPRSGSAHITIRYSPPR